MSYVSLPVRVAVGLMVSAVEQARKLPEQLAELPVTAASRAVQAGMRLQQRVTELAIKGDQVFSLFRPVEDTPPWATFDEDRESPQPGPSHPAGRGKNGTLVVPDRGSEIDEADVARGLTPPKATVTEDAGTRAALLAEYNEMSLAQLRTKLRGFSLSQLEELLVHEHAHRDRPAFVTLLSNRISSVRSQ
jgi:hypothetical protein